MGGDLAVRGQRKLAGLASLKLRRSPYLVMYFRGDKLLFENYITRQTFQANSSCVTILDLFATWKTPSQASRLRPGYTRKSLFEMVERLLNYGLLIREGSEQDELERKFKDKWLWPLASSYYHFSTKIEESLTPEEGRLYYEKYLKGRKQPPIYKTYPDRPRIRLQADSGPEAPFFGTLRRRRTVREFTGKPITFIQLSRIVYNTWGRVSHFQSRAYGLLLHKTSPSAGSRHPVETYAIVNNVDGLMPGLYHYSVEDNSLELLKTGDFAAKCVKFCAGQEWTRNANVVFFMTAVVARTAWKYRVPRAYRAFLLDVGHLSEAFLLVSNALGLGAFCVGIVCETLIERELGIDGVAEAVLFAVGAGQPLTKNLARLQQRDD